MYTDNIIWSTKIINETLDKLRMGIPANKSCFHMGDTELKAANILYELTNEEINEFEKCSNDINYFVENYCTFLTDKGRTTVELRDYQEDILFGLADEEWNEELDEYVPKNRDAIILASRQIGKCLTYNSKIIIKNKINNEIKEISIGKLYDNYNKTKKLKYKIINKLKFLLYSIYNKL